MFKAKKLIAFILTLVMVLNIMPVSVLAEGEIISQEEPVFRSGNSLAGGVGRIAYLERRIDYVYLVSVSLPWRDRSIVALLVDK